MYCSSPPSNYLTASCSSLLQTILHTPTASCSSSFKLSYCILQLSPDCIGPSCSSHLQSLQTTYILHTPTASCRSSFKLRILHSDCTLLLSPLNTHSNNCILLTALSFFKLSYIMHTPTASCSSLLQAILYDAHSDSILQLSNSTHTPTAPCSSFWHTSNFAAALSFKVSPCTLRLHPAALVLKLHQVRQPQLNYIAYYHLWFWMTTQYNYKVFMI